MIVQINNLEAAALVLNMSIMRKNVRNKLKAQNKSEMKDWLASYDYVVKSATEATEAEQSELNLNIKDVQILHEFMRAYQDRIEGDKELKKVITEKDKEFLGLLAGVRVRCEELLQC